MSSPRSYAAQGGDKRIYWKCRLQLSKERHHETGLFVLDYLLEILLGKLHVSDRGR